MSISGDYRLDPISDEAASKLEKAVEKAVAIHIQIEAISCYSEHPYRVHSYEGDEVKKIDMAYLKKLITPELKGYLMYVNCIGSNELMTTVVFSPDGHHYG